MSDKYKYDAASTSCDPLVKFEKSVRGFDENWALYEELTKARETIKKMAEALRYMKELKVFKNPDDSIMFELDYDKINEALKLAKPWLEEK